MSLAKLFSPGRLGLSFELFPPKTAAAEESLWQNVAELTAFKPDFFTCTYGAGGSTQTKTLDICRGVKQRFGLPVASHLTCVGSTVDQLRGYLGEAQSGWHRLHRGAVRGDPPKGETAFKAVEGGFALRQRVGGPDSPRISALRRCGGRLSRKASGMLERSTGLGKPQAEGGGRGRYRGDPTVLRQCRLLSLSRLL